MEKGDYTTVDTQSFLANDERKPLKQKTRSSSGSDVASSRSPPRPQNQDFSSLFLAATDTKKNRSTRPPRRGSLEKDVTDAFLSATSSRVKKNDVAPDTSETPTTPYAPAFSFESVLSFFHVSLLRASSSSSTEEESAKSERQCTSVFLSTIDRGNGRKCLEREHDNTSSFLSSVDRAYSRHRDQPERTCIKI
eukprot:comp20273_c0_seq1/m.25396 comp20273_c0_seq1/g.25396  ORF comp20273_c0_seq1/g.25396 comp20273_c0_seq1/m.25396 type:complete len:193 (-) comp20273_c0_seq1:369-947(-)